MQHSEPTVVTMLCKYRSMLDFPTQGNKGRAFFDVAKYHKWLVHGKEHVIGHRLMEQSYKNTRKSAGC